MANLISLNFQNDPIRTFVQDDIYYFCLADICKILNLKNPTHTANQIKEEFGCPTLNVGHIKDSLNRTQSATFITEPQLYYIMNRSNAKNARNFRMWVNCEVLPQIRKHGAYIAPHKEDDKSFIETFKNFCLQNNYSAREVEMFKWFGEMKLKQGYAIACAQLKERVKPEEAEPKEAPSAKMLKDDEIAIPKATAKHIYEYLDWISKHRKEMMQTASDMREQSRVLMLAAEGMLVTRSLVKDSIFNKL